MIPVYNSGHPLRDNERAAMGTPPDSFIPSEHPAQIIRREIDSQTRFIRSSDGTICAGLNDETAGETFDYCSLCSLCWLGYGHSGNVHRASIARDRS